MTSYAIEYNLYQLGSTDGRVGSYFHDKGLLRASNSTYKPRRDPEIKGNKFKTLFVYRLMPSVTQEMIQEAFLTYGPIRYVRNIKDLVTKEPKGYAFVEYEHESSCIKAYNDANQIFIGGSQVAVDFQRAKVMRGWIPRRYGGGLGGRKESGQMRFGGRSNPFYYYSKQAHPLRDSFAVRAHEYAWRNEQVSSQGPQDSKKSLLK